MTTTLPAVVLAGLLVGVAAPAVLHAQPYSLDWSTVDGGGNTSTAGSWSLRGTIGQPDAGRWMRGDNYMLQGGFWAFAALPAPALTIVPAGSGVLTISWAPDSPGWVLQETLSLSPAHWVNSPSGSANPVTIPISGTMKFYRLHRP